MGHLVRREPWGVVDLDTDAGHVFVRQDWRYEWRSSSDVPPWTAREKAAFHRTVDHLVWKFWSFRAYLQVQRLPGSTSHALAGVDGRGLSLSFDVRRVLIGGHWSVTAHKANPNRRPFGHASTDFGARKIELFTTDVTPHDASRFAGDRLRMPGFYVAPHEFGHALGYGYSRGDGEEYDGGHPFFGDVTSLMNIGREIRPRHVRLIVETLETMVPGYKFIAECVTR